MVDKIKSKIRQNVSSRTQYIVIPSDMVVDSSYPFVKDEEVELEITSNKKGMTVKKIE